MDQVILYVWLSVTAIATLSSLVIRKKQGRSLPSSEDYAIAAISLGGAVALLKVFFTVVLQEQLQAQLDWDGTVAICVSTLWLAFRSLEEAYTKIF